MTYSKISTGLTAPPRGAIYTHNELIFFKYGATCNKNIIIIMDQLSVRPLGQPDRALTGWPKGLTLTGWPKGLTLTGWPKGLTLTGWPKGLTLTGWPKGPTES